MVLVGRFYDATEKNTKAYESLSAKLAKARIGAFDLEHATRALNSSSDELETQLEELKKQVKIPFDDIVDIPEEMKADGGAYFRLQHAEVSRRLDIECRRGQVVLSDPDLGFEEILAKMLNNEQAQENLNRLSIVRRIIQLLVKAGVVQIIEISHTEPALTGAEGYDEFIREYPVRITVRSRLDPLMRFLHEIRRPGEFFLVVRELMIHNRDFLVGTNYSKDQQVAADELLVVISAAGMRFPSEEEAAKEKAKAGPRKPDAGGKFVPSGPVGVPRGI